MASHKNDFEFLRETDVHRAPDKIGRRDLFKLSGAALMAGAGFRRGIWTPDGGTNPPVSEFGEDANANPLRGALSLIFPEPPEMEQSPQFFGLERASIFLPDGASSSDAFLAKFLTEELSDRYDLQLQTARRSGLAGVAGPVIVMGSAQSPAIREYCAKKKIDLTPENPGPEGYSLHIDEQGVLIAGSDDAGAFYGLQSLRQLTVKNDQGIQVPGIRVRDWPDKPFRGVKVYVPGPGNIQFFKRYLRDFVALYKFNKLMLEMNACMRLDKHPELNAGWIEFARDTNYSRLNYPPHPLHGREQNSSHQDCGDGTFIEKDDVRDLVRWAEQLHIEVIPEIPSLTHSFYLLTKHKDLSEVPGDKWPDTYCPSNPKSYDLLFDVMDEYIEVMKPKMVHTGHDEWFALVGLCPRCKGKDPGELYGGDVRKVHEYLAKQNIKMAIWGDYLLQSVRGKGLRKHKSEDGWIYYSPGAMSPQQVKDLVPTDILIFNWFWSRSEKGEANEAQLDEMGFRQIYGNMEPDLRNYSERSKRATIIGGVPSSWAATTEFNLGKDLLYSTMGCSSLLWSNRPLDAQTLSANVQASMPRTRNALSGVTLPTEAGDPATPLDISPSFNMPHGSPPFGVDLREMSAGKVHAGNRMFDLVGDGGQGAVIVGSEGKEPNPLPRQASIHVGQDATSLIFLHACAVPATNKEAYRLIWDFLDSADLLGSYEVVYEDGLAETIPIRYGVNILEWNWTHLPTSKTYCYSADAVVCGGSPQKPIIFFALEWISPRLGKVIQEVRMSGSTRFRGAVPGFENYYGDVIPGNAVMLKALSVVKPRS
jgi:Glycosyl hydrolase family 20, domain 2/Glycosyl hydrolase family 20, catalytic domain